MGTAKVTLSEDAREDFRKLDGAARRIVAKGLKKLDAAVRVPAAGLDELWDP
ncbi:hypothetical protein [Pseudonocardia phyllosphaerae]|uniref:hypothetical protein n=1 Tax=Pseudonocardia phyllosphaerae TaxID=3390502 RepID=UPI0039783983